MARSLNPKATDAAPVPATSKSAAPSSEKHAAQGPPRRDVLSSLLAGLLGLVAGIVPPLVGLPVLLNPLRKKKGDGGSAAGTVSLRVATLDSLPADGRPVNVPVISDKVDAWTREAAQPVGAVFLRRVGNQVECFNAICPHAGCMVAYSGERDVFQCPCHTSSFETDGKRIMPSPSPRDMDRLTVDSEKLKQGEVWVEFVNYYPGKEHQEPKG